MPNVDLFALLDLGFEIYLLILQIFDKIPNSSTYIWLHTLWVNYSKFAGLVFPCYFSKVHINQNNTLTLLSIKKSCKINYLLFYIIQLIFLNKHRITRY